MNKANMKQNFLLAERKGKHSWEWAAAAWFQPSLPRENVGSVRPCFSFLREAGNLDL